MIRENDTLLKKKEVCRILNVNITTLDKMVKEGYLDYIKFNNHKVGTIRFRKSDVYKLISEKLSRYE